VSGGIQRTDTSPLDCYRSFEVFRGMGILVGLSIGQAWHHRKEQLGAVHVGLSVDIRSLFNCARTNDENFRALSPSLPPYIPEVRQMGWLPTKHLGVAGEQTAPAFSTFMLMITPTAPSSDIYCNADPWLEHLHTISKCGC
jgi:hypothetical protein